MTTTVGIVCLSADRVLCGVAHRTGADWRLTHNGDHTSLATACAGLAGMGTIREVVVQIPTTAAFWSVVDLKHLADSERPGAIQLQEQRLRTEHPGHLIRSSLDIAGQRLLLTAVPHALVSEIKQAVATNGLQLKSLIPAPLTGRGYLEGADVTVLVCPDAGQTTLARLRGGIREAATTIPWPWSLPQVEKAISRLQMAVPEPLSKIQLIGPSDAAHKALADEVRMLGDRFQVPVTIREVPSDEPGLLLAAGVLHHQTTAQLRSGDFAFERQDVGNSFWRRYWPAALAVAGLLVMAIGTWSYTSWQAHQRRLLEQDLAAVEEKLQSQAPVAALHEFLTKDWDRPNWLPALNALADSAPATGIKLDRVVMEVGPSAQPHLRVEGHAQQPETILDWNEELLQRRAGYEVLPHAIEQVQAESTHSQRFVMELEVQPVSNLQETP